MSQLHTFLYKLHALVPTGPMCLQLTVKGDVAQR